MKEAALNAPEKKVVLIKQVQLVAEGRRHDENEVVRQLYLARKFTDAAKEVANISATSVQYETDPTGHPSENGTVQIINMLHSKSLASSPLIWNPAYIVSKTAYRGVESIFRYGCNTCDRYGEQCTRDRHANPLLCDACADSFTNGDNPVLQAIVKRVSAQFAEKYNEEFPGENKRRRVDEPGDVEDQVTNGDGNGKEDDVMDEDQ